VSLVVLSFFRDEQKAVQLANLVKSAGGMLGAAVCCAENGGDPNDDWTTCDRDRDVLLDRCAPQRQAELALICMRIRHNLHTFAKVVL
jgi:hypothetical protein